MLGVSKCELRWLVTCLRASENIVRVESFNFCIDLRLVRYGQNMAYFRSTGTLLGCEATASDAMRAFMTDGSFLRGF